MSMDISFSEFCERIHRLNARFGYESSNNDVANEISLEVEEDKPSFQFIMERGERWKVNFFEKIKKYLNRNMNSSLF